MGLPFPPMHLGIRNERSDTERRVAATPVSVSSFTDLGFIVSVETGAGTQAGFTDTAYADAGASVVESLRDGDPVDLLIKITPPGDSDRDLMSAEGVILGLVDPTANNEMLTAWGDTGITSISMELVPRTTLAQSMDVLSSQAT